MVPSTVCFLFLIEKDTKHYRITMDCLSFHVLLVVPAPPRILRIDSGVDNMEIHWEVSAVDPDSPVLNYLVQVTEKDGSHQWMNCARITPQKSSGSMLCVMNELKSGTEYIVRIAARNIVGYSAFTVKHSSTKPETGNNRSIYLPLKITSAQIVDNFSFQQ